MNVLLATVVIAMITAILTFSKQDYWDKKIKKKIPMVVALAILSPFFCLYNSILSTCALVYWIKVCNNPLYKSQKSRNTGPVVFMFLIDVISCAICIIIIPVIITIKYSSCKKNTKETTRGNSKSKSSEITQRAGPEQEMQRRGLEQGTQRRGTEQETQIGGLEQETQRRGLEQETQIGGSEQGIQRRRPGQRMHKGGPEQGTQQGTMPETLQQTTQKTAQKANMHKIKGNKSTYGLEWYVLLSFMIVGPTISTITHIPYIAIAYLDDGNHAGSIFIYYTIILSITYSISWISLHPLKSLLLKHKNKLPPKTVGIIGGLGIAGAVLLIFFVFVISVYFVLIPINKSISDAPNRLVGIYQSGGFLIATFIVYKLISFFYSSDKQTPIETVYTKTSRLMSKRK